MRGPFSLDGETSFASLYSLMRDPRVVYSSDDRDISKIPSRSGAIPFTVIVPISAINPYLWETIYGLSFQRYDNWTVLFVCAGPDLKAQVESVLVSHSEYLPRYEIFMPKRKLILTEMLNAALNVAHTDYVCLKDVEDHLHPSALAVMSQAVAKSKAGMYCTHRYKMTCAEWARNVPQLKIDNAWSGNTFPFRGLYTFNRVSVAGIGGFHYDIQLDDPTMYVVYSLLDNDDLKIVPASVYFSRDSSTWTHSRGQSKEAVELRKKFIAQYWPKRAEGVPGESL